MYNDRRTSARARSAQIRRSHDLEATELDSMRRRTAHAAARPDGGSRMTRVVRQILRRTGAPRPEHCGELIARPKSGG
jgi:hypothetical protein